ncbi:MAG TPA: DinB family protein [Vicinamibacterales bacterium]|nr:DinB family protein [Vicinamibacterales bacterium]
MAILDALLPEYDHEMATTRRLLDRVPESHFGWKPHDKSMTLGQLSGHLANIPYWCSATLDAPSLDLATLGDEATPKAPASRDALLQDFDRRVAAARERLAKTTDPEFLAPWTLKSGDQEFFTMPRISAIRSFVMNHSIHHRGQLSVYLRLNDVAVPPIYGPTADEQF